MNSTISQIQKSIKTKGKIVSSKGLFLKNNISIHGKMTLIPANKMVGAKLPAAAAAKAKSNITQVGEAPNGFGKIVNWDEGDQALAIIAFLSAADPNGLMISGVKNTDTIEFPLADGIASFAEETKNKGVGSFIGIVAAGATATAAAFGVPELAPVIGAAEKFAKSQFEEKKVKTKRRDPFGEDPGTGHKAKQEGGVIVCLPRKDKTTHVFYSGNSDHKERWIKEPGTRDTAHLPTHVDSAFFLSNSFSNKRIIGSDGDIIIAPWDHIFEDNFGFYRLHILLKRGSGKDPIVR